MQEKKAGVRSGYPPLTDLLSRFDQFMEVNFSQAQPTSVNKNRAKILQQCREKAYLSPGIFSLTVPTGGGKTLSGMAFALGHALSHGKNRIIYVIPYTSIIEQTVGIFRSIFGEAVIEHHSSLDPEQETQKSRLACENWDAPIIVTTNVQFFESLFTARTSRIRKLHNMVQSVVVLDEAQLLPPEFLKPIVNVIQDLVDHYGLTLVLSTATQPALKELNEVKNSIPQLKNVRELMDKPEELYSSLQRVKVEIPENLHVGKSWGQVAKELKEHPTVLCVVNRRADCQELFRLMPEGTFHLSGLMCGEHRSQTIDGIKLNLKKNQTVRVISTQLVEAGVDLDFPVVFRALAGLDSIAQAAGRCNREGKLNRGIVKIFVPDKPAPVGLLRKGEQTARQLLQQPDIELQGLEVFQKYFELFYAKVNDFDKHGILKDLDSGPKLEIQFRTAASKFKLIDEKNQAPVIVRYQNSNKWIECLRVTGPDRGLMRKLQRYVVTIPKPLHEKLKVQGDIEEIHPGIFVQTFHALYHPKLGFLGDRDLYHDPKDYVI